jgi:ABC-type multidrug transport system ATPase subunit
MKLELRSLSKKFNKNHLFKNLNLSIAEGETVAITGANGSGKSTLLKIISGLIAPQKGEIIISVNQHTINKEDYHKHINICAPYVDLIEDFTLEEHLNFHSQYKKPVDINFLLEELKNCGLEPHRHKLVREFSSGMKQRLKLILTCCFSGEILLLDEPSSHLDESGKNWYKRIINKRVNNSITLIFSNDVNEYINFTENLINIESLKQ